MLSVVQASFFCFIYLIILVINKNEEYGPLGRLQYFQQNVSVLMPEFLCKHILLYVQCNICTLSLGSLQYIVAL